LMNLFSGIKLNFCSWDCLLKCWIIRISKYQKEFCCTLICRFLDRRPWGENGRQYIPALVWSGLVCVCYFDLLLSFLNIQTLLHHFQRVSSRYEYLTVCVCVCVYTPVLSLSFLYIYLWTIWFTRI
jgi:hypothetical protein